MVAPRIHSCFDFRLRSEIPLVELAASTDDDQRPIVDVRTGDLPAILDGAGPAERGLQVAGGSALLTVPDVARYLISGGREIIVCPLPSARDRQVRLFLLGSALAILCYQRGLFPVHANALVVGRGAVAFAGHQGAGKSTLAAWFHRAGREILCDDVCMISFDSAGQPHALPGLPRLKLWRDAVAAFGHDGGGLDRVLDDMDKFQVPLPARFDARPYPLRRLYILGRAGEAEPTSILLERGNKAMEAVMAQTYRGAYVGPLGLTARHFQQCLQLLSRTQVYAVSRQWGYDLFDREAKYLERHMIELEE